MEQRALRVDSELAEDLMSLLDLFRPRWMHSRSDVRRRALSAIHDAEVLDTVARWDPDPALRRLAVERMRDPQQLREIASEHDDADVRRAALDRLEIVIQNQEALQRARAEVDTVREILRGDLHARKVVYRLKMQGFGEWNQEGSRYQCKGKAGHVLFAVDEDGHIRSCIYQTLEGLHVPLVRMRSDGSSEVLDA